MLIPHSQTLPTPRIQLTLDAGHSIPRLTVTRNGLQRFPNQKDKRDRSQRNLSLLNRNPRHGHTNRRSTGNHPRSGNPQMATHPPISTTNHTPHHSGTNPNTHRLHSSIHRVHLSHLLRQTKTMGNKQTRKIRTHNRQRGHLGTIQKSLRKICRQKIVDIFLFSS